MSVEKIYIKVIPLAPAFEAFEFQFPRWPVSAIPYYVLEHACETVIGNLIHYANDDYSSVTCISYYEEYGDYDLTQQEVLVELSRFLTPLTLQSFGGDLISLKNHDMVIEEVNLNPMFKTLTVKLSGW